MQRLRIHLRNFCVGFFLFFQLFFSIFAASISIPENEMKKSLNNEKT